MVHQHITLAQLAVLPEGQLGYKTAAFVRNPYDRAYSGFVQIQRDSREQPALEFQADWIASMVRAQISANMERVVAAGFDFNRWIELLPEYEVFDAARNTNMPLHPVNYWTHLAGEKKVDFVGRVESFATDFHSLCDYLGIAAPEVVIANNSDEVRSTPNASKYAGRMCRRAIDRINHLFRDDFEYFGYEML